MFTHKIPFWWGINYNFWTGELCLSEGRASFLTLLRYYGKSAALKERRSARLREGTRWGSARLIELILILTCISLNRPTFCTSSAGAAVTLNRPNDSDSISSSCFCSINLLFLENHLKRFKYLQHFIIIWVLPKITSHLNKSWLFWRCWDWWMRCSVFAMKFMSASYETRCGEQ